MSVVVNDIPPWIQYIAAGGQTVYIVPFLFFAQTDLNVYSRAQGAAVSDQADLLTYNVDYTVTINAAPAVGGTITLNTPSTLNDIVTIYRNQPDQRLNNYSNGGPFEAPVVNPDFQQIVLMTQQNKFYDQNLCPHYNVNATTTPNVDNILPVLAPNTMWIKNAAGTAIVAGQPVNGVVVPGVNGNFVSFAGGAIVDSGVPVANVPRILTTKIPVSSAQFRNMFAVPVDLLPPPGVGKAYFVNGFYMIMNYGAVPYQNGGAVVLRYTAGITNPIAANFFYNNFSAFLCATAVSTNIFTLASINNAPLTLTNITGAFTDGDSNFLVNIQYTIIDLI